MEPIFRTVHYLKMMKKSIVRVIPFLMCMLMLSGCSGLSEHELKVIFGNRPPAVTMPYENPRYILQSVPDQLPFSFVVPDNGELLGSIEDSAHASGTILMKVDQNASDILKYFTDLLTDATFTNSNARYRYQVFFPPEEDGATFCSESGTAVILEVFEFEDGSKDVRLHYTNNREIMERTTCGQPILVIEDFPFPHLLAPSTSSIVGGGGGGSGGEKEEMRKGVMGYSAEIVINSNDSLDFIDNHYRNMLSEEGWKFLNQSLTENSNASDWDFGFYTTRSWLARLIVSVGETPNQYRIELRAISP